MRKIIKILLLFFTACSQSLEKGKSSPECKSSEIASSMEKLSPEEVIIYADEKSNGNLEISYEHLKSYLERIWGVKEIKIIREKPDFSVQEGKTIIWFTSSQDAKNLTGTDIKDGFLIKKVNLSGKQKLFIIYAPDEKNLSYAVYKFLELLGIRFFHPMKEFIPEYKNVYLPRDINLQISTHFKTRGIHLHLLHPIEYFNSFNIAGDENLEEAKKFIDYIVKTGQNYIQWSILKTLDFPTWFDHAKKIIEYAHARGVSVGAEIQLLGISSLQNSYVLVESESNWKEQITSKIEFLMQVPWDNIEIGFGEFLAGEPEKVVEMLNFIADYMNKNHPKTTVSVVNHVGNYPKLWVKYNNETVFYYHLPKFADPRIINNVHTVFFFDLYRDWGGYNHPDFHFQREYMMELLRESRVARYKPESAYWATADIDVPAFLPEYIYSRWIDINGLVKEISEKGLPMIEGHVIFSSGHEWGYWMTDYLTAKMLWESEENFEHFIEYYADIYGKCGEKMKKILLEFINLQTEYLFENRLVPYISYEDFYDDIGYMAGIETHPKRVQFEEILSMRQDEVNSFEEKVLKKIYEMVQKIIPLEEETEKLCDSSDEFIKPWCLEISDGIKIVRLRLLHSFKLYKKSITDFR
ncbi:hypothetical protein HRbin19_00260 [bacterium HR19]|nr:hypothetical protein HRbin19_00260 [bacterium HR19]